MANKYWHPTAQPISYQRKVQLKRAVVGTEIELTMVLGANSKIFSHAIESAVEADALDALVADIQAANFPELNEAEIAVDDDGNLVITGPPGVPFAVVPTGPFECQSIIDTARVYELSDGVDAAGLGPTLTGGSYGTGFMGNGLSANSTATVATAPGIDLRGEANGGDSWVVAFWKNTTGTLNANATIVTITLKDNAVGKAGKVIIRLVAEAASSQYTIEIESTTTTTIGPFVLTEAWHYFVCKNAEGQLSITIDPGSAGEITDSGLEPTWSAGDTPITAVANANIGTGRVDQLMIANGFLDSDADMALLYNAGSGLPFTSWTTFYTPASLPAVTATGPEFFDVAANWEPSGVPSGSDTPIFENTNRSCRYYSGSTYDDFTAVYINASFTGEIGLPYENPNGYMEYRPQFLRIDALNLYVGNGEGEGSPRLKISNQHASNAKNVFAKTCGSRVNQNVPSFLYTAGGTGSGQFNIFDRSDVGVSGNEGELATTSVGDFDSAPGSKFFGGSGCTFNGSVDVGGQVTHNGTRGAAATRILPGGNLLINGASTSYGTTIQVFDQGVLRLGSIAPSSVTLGSSSLTLFSGSKLDLTEGLSPVTITSLLGYSGATVVDPNKRFGTLTSITLTGALGFTFL